MSSNRQHPKGYLSDGDGFNFHIYFLSFLFLHRLTLCCSILLLSRVVSQVGDFVQIDRRHYNNVTMRIISGVVPGVSRLARLQELSRKARRRLKWFDYYNSHAHNARLTCRYFGISPQTFYRWKRRYNPHRLESRMPFPVRAMQVDGRAEFEAVFEEECQRRDIKLFVLPPGSPRWFTPTGSHRGIL